MLVQKWKGLKKDYAMLKLGQSGEKASAAN